MTQQLLTKKYREALGYKEHAGSISVRRASTALPDVDWITAIKNERSPLNMLVPMNAISMVHGIYCYAISGRLKQHIDCVSPNEMTSGIILQCSDDLELNAWGKKIPVKTGDQFLLDPHRSHGADTKGLLVFAALDEDISKLMNADQALSYFIAKLSILASEFPLQKDAS